MANQNHYPYIVQALHHTARYNPRTISANERFRGPRKFAGLQATYYGTGGCSAATIDCSIDGTIDLVEDRNRHAIAKTTESDQKRAI